MCQEKCARCHEDLISWLIHKDPKCYGEVCCFLISLAVFFVSAALYVTAVAVAWTLVGEYGTVGAIVISLPVLGPAMLCVAPCVAAGKCCEGVGGDCDGCEAVDCGDLGDVNLSGGCSSFFCLVIILLIWLTIAVIIVTGGVVIMATTSGPTDIVPAENQTGAIVAGVLAILSGLLCAGSVCPCIYLCLSTERKKRRTPRTVL